MKFSIALALILFVAACRIEYVSGQTPCEVVAHRACEDIWPDFPYGFVGCGGTACVNDVCPDNAEESGPTPEGFSEIMDELDAIGDDLWYDGPYETFSSPFTVPCRYKITCTLCNPFLGTDVCATDLEYWEEDPLVSFCDERRIIEGVDWCEEEWF